MSLATPPRTTAHDPMPPAEAASFKTPVWLLVVKWLLLAAVVAFAFWVATRLTALGYEIWIVLVAFVVMAILAVYSTRRFIPMKYLLPGLLLLLGLQVWPMIMTVQTAFTNYGQGHALSKEEATNSIIANSVLEVEGAERYRLSIAVAVTVAALLGSQAPAQQRVPAPDEEAAVERLLGISIPTRDEMAEIEESARLYEERGALVMRRRFPHHRRPRGSYRRPGRAVPVRGRR